ncbi:hypothetical protein [Xanthobacter agilis]|uniref:N-acetylglutamate synthase/N-acetylornithine aminotransferase n=1 Tax=Xanthobacter agilis TaxID=47492 RepID=A0ABU0LFV7_XANAG|nr:hypothetical protein [Xanthobacter agilis]MDQ0506009.1 N-acetylglutamate synthase/N-acetylornithine aminotransferase [Xanthobacter agilis]
MIDDTAFSDRLAVVIAEQASHARRDPALYAEMIERLSHALGLTIAMAARGDGRRIDVLIEGATSHAHAEAVAWAPLAQVMRG